MEALTDPFTPAEYDAKYEVLSRSIRFSMMKDFLHALFDPYEERGYLEIRAIAPPNRIKQNFCPLTMMKECFKDIFRWSETLNEQGYGIYVGVLPRCRESGRESDIREAAWIWADLDFKGEGEAVVTDRLSKLPGDRYPDMVVLSGNGIHAYCKLTKIVDLEGRLPRFKAAVRVFQKEMQPHSDSVHDASRVLRLPGFTNKKDPANPKPVTLVPIENSKAIISHAA